MKFKVFWFFGLNFSCLENKHLLYNLGKSISIPVFDPGTSALAKSLYYELCLYRQDTTMVKWMLLLLDSSALK
jgi:hypothetical protein